MELSVNILSSILDVLGRVLITPPYKVTNFLSELNLSDLSFASSEAFLFAYLFVYLKLIAFNELFDSLNVSVQI